MFKPFYIHFNRQITKKSHGWEKHAPRGFTALIQPDPNNERNALMQVTFCSPKDQFCKKTGRSQVTNVQVESVNKRDVPDLLSGSYAICRGRKVPPKHAYDYVYKYLL